MRPMFHDVISDLYCTKAVLYMLLNGSTSLLKKGNYGPESSKYGNLSGSDSLFIQAVTFVGSEKGFGDWKFYLQEAVQKIRTLFFLT